MADVFVSYSRQDRAIASAVCEAISNAGFSCWWDTSLVAGEHFNQAIEEQLTKAKCVLVLWTQASHRSQWVQAEAIHGFNARCLVSARLDGVELQYPFGIIQTADLRGFQPGQPHDGVREVIAGITSKVGRAAISHNLGYETEDRSNPVRELNAKVVVGCVIAVAVGISAWAILSGQDAHQSTIVNEPLATEAADFEDLSSRESITSNAPPNFDAIWSNPSEVTRLEQIGRSSARVCSACHALEAHEPKRAAPDLYNLFGRRAGSQAGFNYTLGIARFETWDEQSLYEFFTNPPADEPLGATAFHTLFSADQRAAMIIYLKSRSDAP